MAKELWGRKEAGLARFTGYACQTSCLLVIAVNMTYPTQCLGQYGLTKTVCTIAVTTGVTNEKESEYKKAGERI